MILPPVELPSGKKTDAAAGLVRPLASCGHQSKADITAYLHRYRLGPCTKLAALDVDRKQVLPVLQHSLATRIAKPFGNRVSRAIQNHRRSVAGDKARNEREGNADDRKNDQEFQEGKPPLTGSFTSW